MDKKIKKKILLKLLPVFFIFTPLIFCCLIVIAAISEAKPIAEESTVSKYRSASTPFGVAWDIVLLVDMIRADQNDENINDYNPVDTALEFSCLAESKYKITPGKDVGDVPDAPVAENKMLDTITNYKGKYLILSYIDVSELGSMDALSITSKANEIATGKSTKSYSYEAAFKARENIEQVLSDIFGFNDDEIQDIMEMHENNYLTSLYGDSSGTIGSVTIGEYADVEDAVHEYLLGIGFNEIGACATMANIAVESGFNTAANHNNHYFGLCQWGGGRWYGNPISLLEYSKGTEWFDLQTQLDFFQLECSVSYSDVFNQMMYATDLMYATDYFCSRYEICIGQGGAWTYSLVDGKPYQDLLKRRAKAELYYAKYGKEKK